MRVVFFFVLSFGGRPTGSFDGRVHAVSLLTHLPQEGTCRSQRVLAFLHASQAGRFGGLFAGGIFLWIKRRTYKLLEYVPFLK